MNSSAANPRQSWKTGTAIASLVLIAVPPLVARFTVSPLVEGTGAPDSVFGLLAVFSRFSLAVTVGSIGFILAGACLDGMKYRPAWYLICLAILGFAWIAMPGGLWFGAAILIYVSYHLLRPRFA